MADLPSLVDRTYLLNLKRREDRLERFMAQDAVREWPLAPIRVFEAVDGAKVPSPAHWRSGEGAWGCMQSHRRILEECIMDDVQSVLVLEDDALFVPDFHARLSTFLDAVPHGDPFQGLWLGGQHIGAPPGGLEQAAPGVVRCVNCQRTHAYVLRGAFIRTVYRALVGGAGHCDHLMGPLQKDALVWAPDPFLVAQAAGKSDITCRDEHMRSWSVGGPTPTVLLLAVGAREHVEALLRQGAHVGYWRDEKTGVDKGLLAAMTMKAGPAMEKGVRTWWEYVKNEAAAIDGGVPMLWHPRAHELEGVIGKVLPGVRLVRVSLAGGERLSELVR